MENPEDILGFTPEGAGEFDPAKNDNETRPAIRGDRFSVDSWRDQKKMITFINSMRHVPIEGIDDQIVHDSYPAAVWYFRKAAIDGDLKATSAMKLWLDWAKPILGRKKIANDIPQSLGSAAFLPRIPLTAGDREETE